MGIAFSSESQFTKSENGLSARPRAELGEYDAQVRFYGAARDGEIGSDFLVRFPPGNEPENFSLARG